MAARARCLAPSIDVRAQACASSRSIRRRANPRESLDLTVPRRSPRVCAVSSSERSRKYRHATTSCSSSRRLETAWSRRCRSSEARTVASGDGAAPPEGSAAARRSVSVARRPAERRRFLASLATIWRSQGRNGAPLPKAPQRAVGLHEALLRSVSCLVSGPCDEVSSPECDSLISAHKLLVGADIPALRLFDEVVFLFQWPALHCSYYTASQGAVPLRRCGSGDTRTPGRTKPRGARGRRHRGGACVLRADLRVRAPRARAPDGVYRPGRPVRCACGGPDARPG